MKSCILILCKAVVGSDPKIKEACGMIERKVVAFECGETGKWRWAAERSGVA